MPEETMETLARVAKALASLPEDVQENVVSKIEFGADMFLAGCQHAQPQAGSGSA